MEQEILSDDELADITGYASRAWQRRWLNDRHWHFVESRGKRPLVGRQYARMKLGTPIATSLDQNTKSAIPVWAPDFSRVN